MIIRVMRIEASFKMDDVIGIIRANLSNKYYIYIINLLSKTFFPQNHNGHHLSISTSESFSFIELLAKIAHENSHAYI